MEEEEHSPFATNVQDYRIAEGDDGGDEAAELLAQRAAAAIEST